MLQYKDMPLRGSRKNLPSLLLEFERQMSVSYLEYTTIVAFREFAAVDILFKQFNPYIETISPVVMLEGLQYGIKPRDQPSNREIEENWQPLEGSSYASNHIKLKCLENLRSHLFDLFHFLNPFNEFCVHSYKNSRNINYKADLNHYFELYYPNLTADMIGKIIDHKLPIVEL